MASGVLVRLALGFALGSLCQAAAAADSTVHTDPLNYDPVVRDAYQHFYNLDYDGALARFEQVEKAHPKDPIATTYRLNCILFRELYRLDLLDTTFYANDGFLTGKHTIAEDPKVRDQIDDLYNKATQQADDVLKDKPDDVNALFARGWARSLKATYEAMVERSFVAGLRLALRRRGDRPAVNLVGQRRQGRVHGNGERDGRLNGGRLAVAEHAVRGDHGHAVGDVNADAGRDQRNRAAMAGGVFPDVFGDHAAGDRIGGGGVKRHRWSPWSRMGECCLEGSVVPRPGLAGLRQRGRR